MTYWQDPYKTLGVPREATTEEIRLAHQELISQHHPDKYRGVDRKFAGGDKFSMVQEAYNLLRDPEQREIYDLVRPLETEKGEQKAARMGPPSKPPKSKSRQIRPNGILVARGYVNGLEVNAIPDTGASCNIISFSFARRLGFQKPTLHDERKPLQMANGKLLHTIGGFLAAWQFSTGPLCWRITFHVLDDFIYDVVLGNELLRATQTMSLHQQRLSRIPRAPQALSVLFVNNLGPVNQRLLGTINDKLVEALPDSGSEPNLVSFEYAVRQGWRNEIDRTDIRLLQFADGTVQRTMGSLTVIWKFRTPTANQNLSLVEGVTVMFHILHGCVYDAMLGQDILMETDAFVEHQESFVDIDEFSGPSSLNLVMWLSSKDEIVPNWRQKSMRQYPSNTPRAASKLQDPTTRSKVSHGLKRRGAIRYPDHPNRLRNELERRAVEERRARRKLNGPGRKVDDSEGVESNSADANDPSTTGNPGTNSDTSVGRDVGFVNNSGVYGPRKAEEGSRKSSPRTPSEPPTSDTTLRSKLKSTWKSIRAQLKSLVRRIACNDE
ncbi:hypothetical protein NM208_g1335 [Fusarium decemcellulare]|uniref:Uncharacterized protein n=1 Tax=Fusarium decemcellulare TaxID=57161 RepID=A0ACC1SWP5_9HYPO|nr:hypothetical protein NM208_g1335 [Fusarium decemcellulare]